MGSEDGSLFIKVHRRRLRQCYSHTIRSGYELTCCCAEPCLLRPDTRTSAGECLASSTTISTECLVIYLFIWPRPIFNLRTKNLVLCIKCSRSSTLLSIPHVPFHERSASQIDANTSPSLLPPIEVRRVRNIGWTYECPVRKYTFGKLANPLCLISCSSSAPEGEKL